MKTTARHREMIRKYWAMHREGPRMMCCQILDDLEQAVALLREAATPAHRLTIWDDVDKFLAAYDNQPRGEG